MSLAAEMPAVVKAETGPANLVDGLRDTRGRSASRANGWSLLCGSRGAGKAEAGVLTGALPGERLNKGHVLVASCRFDSGLNNARIRSCLKTIFAMSLRNDDL
jgi:hypothetical protein